MKHLLSCVAPLVLVGLLVSACGGSSTKIDTSDFEQAFASADASVKGTATDVAKALNAGKYLDGTTALANLAKSAEKLNDDQKNAMINLGATVQLIMSEDGDKADLKVYQAVEDMMAALDGRESAQVGTNPDLVRPPVTEPSE